MNRTLGTITYYKQGKLDIKRTVARRVRDYVKASGVTIVPQKDALLEIASKLRDN